MSTFRTNLGYVDFFTNENGRSIARKHSRVDQNIGLDKPEQEFALLVTLQPTGWFPQPVRQYVHNGYIVVEMECGGNDLQQVMQHMNKADAPPARFPPSVARGYFSQLLQAVRVLHSHGYAHCDIKPENILLDRESNRIVLCDLGQAFQGQYSCGSRGTNGYRAPEVLQQYAFDAFAADMFSLGQVLLTMLTGVNLYDFQANSTIPAWFARVGYAGGDPMRNYLAHPFFQLDSEAIDLLASLFAPAQNRFTLDQVLDHNWMKADLAM